jgi:hypothetical protein
MKNLPYHLERPSLANSYGAVGAKFLTAETADAVAVADLKLFIFRSDRSLRAMALADAALDADGMGNHRLRGQGILE